MIWVTWRQHRTQAIACLALLCVIAIVAVALGAAMRSTFNADGLGACLARSGGAGCPSVISSFTQKFNGGATLPLTILLFAIPAILGAIVGAPLLGQELERGTWQLAWSQTVPRTRWLVTKLALVIGGLVVFSAAVTIVMTWSRAPLDRLTIRLQPPPFNFEGVFLPCSLLCAFSLAVLAGLLLRNTIGAMVVGYLVWEVPFIIVTLLNGPLHILTATKTITCAHSCQGVTTNTVPPVTGNLGDLVLNLTRAGDRLTVTYLPASRFWPLQLIDGGLFLAIAVAALGTAIWLLHRRTR
jgi:ABC-type transport system involved in multi-copper enzyme maturation permease subunit